jgi:hypothetical protein
MTYEEKLVIANDYLDDKANLSWEELSDINSLHDCDTVEEIHAACDERLEEDGFNYVDWEDDDEEDDETDVEFEND